MKLNLDRASNCEQALTAFDNGDARQLVRSLKPMDAIWFLVENVWALKERGIFELALIQGYTWQTTAANVPDSALKLLFSKADRDKLLEAGNPLPDGERFTVYRGVAGFAPNRRVCGWSWSLSKEKAEWFANRFGFLGDPAVYRAEVDRCDVFAYVNGAQQEHEILCQPKDVVRLTPALSIFDAMQPASVRYDKWAARERAAGRDPGTITELDQIPTSDCAIHT